MVIYLVIRVKTKREKKLAPRLGYTLYQLLHGKGSLVDYMHWFKKEKKEHSFCTEYILHFLFSWIAVLVDTIYRTVLALCNILQANNGSGTVEQLFVLVFHYELSVVFWDMPFSLFLFARINTLVSCLDLLATPCLLDHRNDRFSESSAKRRKS